MDIEVYIDPSAIELRRVAEVGAQTIKVTSHDLAPWRPAELLLLRTIHEWQQHAPAQERASRRLGSFGLFFDFDFKNYVVEALQHHAPAFPALLLAEQRESLQVLAEAMLLPEPDDVRGPEQDVAVTSNVGGTLAVAHRPPSRDEWALEQVGELTWLSDFCRCPPGRVAETPTLEHFSRMCPIVREATPTALHDCLRLWALLGVRAMRRAVQQYASDIGRGRFEGTTLLQEAFETVVRAGPAGIVSPSGVVSVPFGYDPGVAAHRAFLAQALTIAESRRLKAPAPSDESTKDPAPDVVAAPAPSDEPIATSSATEADQPFTEPVLL